MQRRWVVLIAVCLLALLGLTGPLGDRLRIDPPEAPDVTSPCPEAEVSPPAPAEASAPAKDPARQPADSPIIPPDRAAAAPPPSEPNRTIHGLLTRADGKPLVRPRVWFLQVRGNHSWVRIPGAVEADGSFSVDVPERLVDGSLKFDAIADGFLLQTYHVPGGEIDTRDVSIRLLPPIRVRGRFVGEDGRPVAGSTVSGHYSPYGYFSATSDPDGRFEFRFPAGLHAAIPVHHRGAPGELLRFEPSSADLDLGDLTVRPGGEIRGRVLSPEGRPVAGAVVDLISGDRFGQRVGRATVDAEGGFVFRNLGRGPFEVFTIRSPGDQGKARLGARAIGLEAGDAPVDLVVRPLIPVTVRFLEEETGAPAELVCAGIRVRRCGEPEHRYSPRHFRDCRKEVLVYVTEPGRYDIRVGAPFRKWTRVDAVEIAADKKNVVEVRIGAQRDA